MKNRLWSIFEIDIIGLCYWHNKMNGNKLNVTSIFFNSLVVESEKSIVGCSYWRIRDSVYKA